MNAVRASFKFRGLMAPVFNSFKNDPSQSINYGVIDPYAKWLKNKGVQGVLVNGTTGEGMSLSVPERQGVAEEWQKACKKYGMTLMVQIGGAPFVDVAELAKHAEELKVDAILCLPELYFRPKNEKDLVRYIGNVSKHCSRTPLFYYHFPMMSKVEVSMPKFLDLAEKEIENIVGIKFSSPDLAEGSACLKLNRFIFLGNNMIFCGALAQGFDCSIMTSLNICPELAIEIFQSMKKGDILNASVKQKELSGVYDRILKDSANSITALKKEFHRVSQIDIGVPRIPN
ncbi:N-acetylneuraminate lyase-like [Lutzomyia longipalpis]|uniref:N-acetylneuraminate lyase-like n=1 Tax=Lutzomyia longipalpis TaxID=7200 RepID=UPI0024842D55|nr:N-acetylneuraminate lyase-like [Lutzomyia longipalpis]